MRTENRIVNVATFFVFLACPIISFGQSYWQRDYGGWMANSMMPTSDGNILLAGYTPTITPSDGYLCKIKPNGDTLWTRIFGGVNGDAFTLSIQTTDGNYLLVGKTNSSGAQSAGWIVKISPNGEMLWTKTISTNASDNFSSITSTPDGNFLLGGSSGTYGWVVKIDQNGDTLWAKTYRATSSSNTISSIIATEDGNFLCAGMVRSDSVLGCSGWLLKIKPNGDTLWSKTFGSMLTNSFNSITATIDGCFLVAGTSSDSYMTRVPVYNGWLLKIDSSGDTIWTRTYSNVLNMTIPTADKNYILAGVNGYHPEALTGEGSLIKITPEGDMLWTENIVTGGAWFGLPLIVPTTDGNYLLKGLYRGNTILICIIADQYVYKDSLFTFKIPTYDSGTLDFNYSPLQVPSGMTVNAGGTVSWTPTTDSVYMDHAKFLVVNNEGRQDTLSFNIFVNYSAESRVQNKNRPVVCGELSPAPFTISTSPCSGRIFFSLPASATSICIYGINGRLIDRLSPQVTSSGTRAVWPVASANARGIRAGNYVAKMTAGKHQTTKPFVYTR